MEKRIKVDKNLIFLEHLLLNIDSFRVYDEDISLLLKELYNMVSNKLYSSLEHKEDFDHIECELIYFY